MTLFISDVSVINPAFNRTSFISYPPAEDALFSMTLYIEFKPYSLRDGIIVYEGNNRDGSGDFMSIIQKDGYLEFRFDTGSGKFLFSHAFCFQVWADQKKLIMLKCFDIQL